MILFRKLKIKGWAKMYQAAKEVVYNTKDCNTQRRCYGYLWTKD